MMFGWNKAIKETRIASRTAATAVAHETRLTLDAQYVQALWRGRKRCASADAPFALFSYYEPVCGKFNAGDAIQTVAVRRALERIGETRFADEPIVRDELSLYDGPPVRCVMQGWFSHSHFFWPSPSVTPVFVGTHFTAPAQQFVSRLMEYAPATRRDTEIGCRDLYTLNYCRAAGIRAYFSRCLTLTLPKRTVVPHGARPFLVDVPAEYMPMIPRDVREGAEVSAQRALESDIGGVAYSPSKQFSLGERLLSLYSGEASLVVTTAIHVAMPCLAMGIPVVFLEGPASRDPNRNTSLAGIIPVHTRDQLKAGGVDFRPACPDMEPLKEAMLENLRLSVMASAGRDVDASGLSKVRSLIASWGVEAAHEA